MDLYQQGFHNNQKELETVPEKPQPEEVNLFVTAKGRNGKPRKLITFNLSIRS